MTPEAAATAPRADVNHQVGKNTMSDKRKSSVDANNPENGARTERVLFVCQKKGAGGQLMVRIAEYRGHRYCDARMWLPTPEGMVPTRKGVSMPLQELRAIGAALIAWNDDQDPGEPLEVA
jgi:hypothetical protein